MADSRWIVSMDGKQLDGQFSTDELKNLVRENPGKAIFVWHQGQQQWVDPTKLPEFSSVVSSAAVGIGGIPKEELLQQAGFFKALLDFRFKSFITVRIMPILYIIIMIAIGLGALGVFFVGGGGAIYMGIRLSSFMTVLQGLLMMVLAPVLAVIYLCLVRMWFEVVMVFFRMKEDMDKLVQRSEPQEAEKK